MRKDVLGKCPVCDEQLNVRTLYCAHCNTEIIGAFSLNKFNYLSKEQLAFVEVFLKNRGSIKEVEKDMNISYPTVRRLLDEVIIALGYKTANEPTTINRLEILAKLESGEITVETATELLNK